jgi:ABC-type polysaccharide/polyol phosphate export permease
MEIWKCRYFWGSLVRMDLRTRYRGSVLGMGWSLLTPVCMSAIICTVVITIANYDPWFYAPFLFSGLTFWYFVVGVTQFGCHCFRAGEGYIRQHRVPMAIYPLRAVLGCSFHYCLALCLVVAVATCLHGFALGPLLGLIPALLLLLVMGWSVAVILGLLTVRFRDTSHIMELVLQALFYSTPLLYPQELLTGRILGAVMRFNPVMPFLQMLRDPILSGQLPGATVYARAVITVVLFAGAAVLALRLEERRLVFHL